MRHPPPPHDLWESTGAGEKTRGAPIHYEGGGGGGGCTSPKRVPQHTVRVFWSTCDNPPPSMTRHHPTNPFSPEPPKQGNVGGRGKAARGAGRPGEQAEREEWRDTILLVAVRQEGQRRKPTRQSSRLIADQEHRILIRWAQSGLRRAGLLRSPGPPTPIIKPSSQPGRERGGGGGGVDGFIILALLQKGVLYEYSYCTLTLRVPYRTLLLVRVLRVPYCSNGGFRYATDTNNRWPACILRKYIETFAKI